MEEALTAGPSSAAGAGRTSSRVKNKSQRALESEDTKKLLARARERARIAVEGGAPESSATAGKRRISKRETKGKREEREVWCLCESTASTGPMIECGGCNDWYHFACIGLDQPTAEKIHKYICPPCEETTSEKTARLFDISTFRSPTPPPGLIPAPLAAKKTVPRKRPLGKPTKPSANASRSTSVDAEDPAEAEGDAASSSGSGDGSSSAEDHTSSSGSDSDSSVHSGSKSRPVKKPRPSRHTPSTITSAQFYKKDKGTPQPLPSTRVPLKSRPSTGKPVTVSAKESDGHAAPGGKMPTLPPARQHVLFKLTAVIRKFFADGMKEDEAEQYAVELEAGLFNAFKEVVGGKETAGQRYKGQFSMLTSSLQPHLQESTRTAILSRSLGPTQVAALSSADLSSQARADEREKARRESLQQTVRQKDEFQGGVIMGREGMERVEQARAAERDQEEARRIASEANERRESMAEASIQAQTQAQNQPMNSPGLGKGPESSDSPVPVASMPMDPSPATATAPIFGVRVAAGSAPGSSAASPIVLRRDSSKVPPSPVVPSPAKPAFNLTSAWGGPAGGSGPQDVLDFTMDTPDSIIDVDLGVDQSTLDLSDFMQVDEPLDTGGYHAEAQVEKEAKKELSPMEIYQQKPVIFSRGLVNPNDRTAPAPHLQARALSTLPPNRNFFTEDEWRLLLPGETIEWTGRVPSAAGVSFLSQMRLSPKWDVFALGLSMPDGQAAEVESIYKGLLEDYVSRDRYAVCLPYGNAPPPRAAKDVYAIPLRPTDKYPDFLDLLDGLTIPAVRDRPMWILVIVIAREEAPAPLPGLTPQYSSSAPNPAYPVQTPLAPPTPDAASELLKAQNLEALMRSIGTLPLATLPNPTQPPSQMGYPPANHLGADSSTPYPSYPPAPAPGHYTGAPVYSGWQPQGYDGGYAQYAGPSQGHQESQYTPQGAPHVYGWNAPSQSGPPGGGYGQYGQARGPGPERGAGQRWDEGRGPGGRDDRDGRGGRGGAADSRDKGRERERFKPVESDQGWGSRKRGGGRGPGGGGY